jgi:hypothetical protein
VRRTYCGICRVHCTRLRLAVLVSAWEGVPEFSEVRVCPSCARSRGLLLVIPRKVGVPRAIALLTHEVSALVKLVKPVKP